MGTEQYHQRSCVRRHQGKIAFLKLLVIATAVAVLLALITSWEKKQNQEAGVNIGGWLVLEASITPSLFNPYISKGVVDEYTLCKHLGQEGAKALLEKHYTSWVSEETFIRIRGLGLNHVRIPIGFWALGTLSADEPYVPSVLWNYLLRAIEWARRYGIRVMVELHAAPGSQNAWNHSGRSGQINWINGTGGAVNAQRTLTYLQQMALDVFRTATGIGKGPLAIIHDGFLGLCTWNGFLAGADRLMMDTHQYIMFDDGLLRMNQTRQLQFACQLWSTDVATSVRAFGPTMVSEFSVAANDCATYLNGIDMGYRWDGTFDGAPPVLPNSTCTNDNAATYDASYKRFLITLIAIRVQEQTNRIQNFNISALHFSRVVRFHNIAAPTTCKCCQSILGLDY
ncbi:hypothetical protein BX616_010427 [Lobosporangium transversale]|nr:hypothetical protein BX616_010427 [Lobosporangium transversale]